MWVTVGSPPAIEARSIEQFAPSLYPGLKTASGARRMVGYGLVVACGTDGEAACATLIWSVGLPRDAATSRRSLPLILQ